MRKRASEIETAHRADLCDGKISFLKVLTDNGMVLALDELVPYAHWITPEGMPKRFDTWFFLAAAPPEQVGAHDGKESTNSIWVSPREALEGGESGRFKLPFPTTRNLIRLGKQASVKAALDDCQGQDDRHRDAGHDEAQRRPPAPHSARGRLRRRGVRGRRGRLIAIVVACAGIRLRWEARRGWRDRMTGESDSIDTSTLAKYPARIDRSFRLGTCAALAP